MKISTFLGLVIMGSLLLGDISILFNILFNPILSVMLISIALVSFLFFPNLLEISTRHETFATGNVFDFSNSQAFKTAITRVIREKMNKLNKIDRKQRDVLNLRKEKGSYHLFLVEAGEELVSELRLIFDLTLRTSSFDVDILQTEFAQALRDTRASNSKFFEDLSEESKTSFLYMQGLPELKTN